MVSRFRLVNQILYEFFQLTLWATAKLITFFHPLFFLNLLVLLHQALCNMLKNSQTFFQTSGLSSKKKNPKVKKKYILYIYINLTLFTRGLGLQANHLKGKQTNFVEVHSLSCTSKGIIPRANGFAFLPENLPCFRLVNCSYLDFHIFSNSSAVKVSQPQHTMIQCL